MKITNYSWGIALVIIMLFSAGCANKFRQAQKSLDWKFKYETAMAYYEKKDYYRAATLFEEILPLVRGLPEGENVQFYLAYCNYYEKNYILSAHHFLTFYQTYARSPKAEEANYMYAYSEYISSPDFNLDQTSSVMAMNAMQQFLNRYPQSKYNTQASTVIQEMQAKLEIKAYENAKGYLKIGSYKAAVIMLENFWLDFPDSGLKEDAAFLKLKAQYLLSQKSYYSLQKERFDKFFEFYEKFIDRYPESEFLKEAEKFYEDSRKKLAIFADQNNN